LLILVNRQMSLSSVVYKPTGKRYIYYLCPHQNLHYKTPNCAKSVGVHKLDDDVWQKVWDKISDPVKFESEVRSYIAKLQSQEMDAEAECIRLQAKLDELELERQKVITGWRKGKITDDELETQKAALWIEECEVKHELADKQLLTGNRAERLVKVAQTYRERIVAGVQVSFDPQTPEEQQALFEWKRQVVQGIVRRVDVLPDKSTIVYIVIEEELLESESLSADLSISGNPACPA
jgi:hypothetical protein